MMVYLPEKLKDTLTTDIEKIVSKYIESGSGYKLFFFGSRVTGKHAERSDIDVGIKGTKPLPSSKFNAIKEKLQNLPTLYRIEFVDFSNVSEDFRRVSLAKIHLIKTYD